MAFSLPPSPFFDLSCLSAIGENVLLKRRLDRADPSAAEILIEAAHDLRRAHRKLLRGRRRARLHEQNALLHAGQGPVLGKMPELALPDRVQDRKLVLLNA